MTTDSSRRESIFATAIEIVSEEERASYLARACGDDVGLRRHLECLVRAHFKAPRSFLEAALMPRRDWDAILTPPLVVSPSSAPSGAGSWRVPEEVGRRYRIVSQLGQGGMGSVYLAHDSHLERMVAVKIPDLGVGTEFEERKQRFRREARAAATIKHPNLCRIYDVGEVDGTLYLTMEYIEGKPMSALLKNGEPLTQRQIALFIRKLALALHEAHRQGVIHRDVKPGNIMITTINQQQEPVIVDFGLARRFDKEEARLTESHALLGTPAYMPPEQIDGALGDLGPACDIYSLGVILYELLAGRLPFQGKRVMEVLAKILTQELEPPRNHRPDIDRNLEAICLKAMAKKVEDRYSTMEEFAAALTGYLDEAAMTPRAKSVIPLRVWTSFAAGVSLIGIAIAVALAPSGLKVKTKDGVIAFEDLPKKAVVLVDGNTCTVEWPYDKGPGSAQVLIPPGKHDVQIKINGIVVTGREVTVDPGKGTPFKVTRALPESEKDERRSISLLDAIGSSPFRQGKVQVVPAEARIRFSLEAPSGDGVVSTWISASKPRSIPAHSTRAILRFRAQISGDIGDRDNPTHGATVAFSLQGAEVFPDKLGPLPVVELREGRWIELSVDLTNVEKWSVMLVTDATFQGASALLVDVSDASIKFEDKR
jgi:serine/threonine protein kinase